MIIESEQCKIEVVRNPRNLPMRANVYYGATLLSGEWPDNTTLIVACDNGRFGGSDCTFGGSVDRMAPNYSYVTVYVD